MAARDSARRTLACRLTPVGEGGISLIELSGPDSAAILDRLFQNPRGVASHKWSRAGCSTGGSSATALRSTKYCSNASGPARAASSSSIATAARWPRSGRWRALAAEGARPAREKEYLARQRRMGLLDRIQEEAARRIPRALTLRAAQVLIDQHEGALAAVRDELLRRAELQPPDWP